LTNTLSSAQRCRSKQKATTLIEIDDSFFFPFFLCFPFLYINQCQGHARVERRAPSLRQFPQNGDWNNDILMKGIQGFRDGVFPPQREETEWEIRATRIIRDTNINDRTRVRSCRCFRAACRRRDILLSLKLWLLEFLRTFPGEDGFETGRGIRDSAEISRPLFCTDRRRIGPRESHRRPIRGSVDAHVAVLQIDALHRAQNQNRQEASRNR